jgi:DNA-binding MarR family transcriptional regulator
MTMADLDEIIHQPIRLRLMAALVAIKTGESAEFTFLRDLLGVTDGNLGAHLATLEKAGYIAIDKDFVGKRPRTQARISRAGRRAFERHLQYLRDIIEGVAPDAG